MNIQRFHSVLARTVLVFVLVLFMSAGWALAQDDDQGPLLEASFSGSSMDPAWIFKLDPTVGYRFNRHFEIDGGLPVYFIHAPSDSLDGYSSGNGIGNAYIDLRLMFSHSILDFSSEVRATAPTGDSDKGLSTGRATIDWTNYFGLSMGKWSPFGSVGLANTVSDTHFFTRPYTSLGFVGHVEGGLTVDPAYWVSIGGSGYAVLPKGEQKIYSKLVARQGGSSLGSGYGGGNQTGAGRGRNRSYETESTTIGTSEIDRDHGFSGWIDIYPVSNMALEIGYNRSTFYDSNSLFFSARFDLGRMLRKPAR